jgi:hypothetical protein
MNDVGRAQRWELSEPRNQFGNEIEPDDFLDCKTLSYGPVVFSIEQPGETLDITFSYMDVPVVNRITRDILLSQCEQDVQFIPAVVGDVSDGFFVLNILHAISCVDETKSHVMKWTAEDNDPSMRGKYRMITNLVVDNSILSGHHICRIKGWEVAIIISDKLKSLFDQHRLTGVLYQKV